MNCKQLTVNACLLLAVSFANLGQADTPTRRYPDTPIPRYTNTAFSCIMHVHTRMSSGQYQLPELTQIAKAQGVDAIFLSDNLLTSIEFGLWPLRHIFYLRHQEKPSVLTIGWPRFLAEVQRENERQADVLYIPGVEIVPRFFWSGSLRQTNLVCHNHQRNLIVLGTYDPPALAKLPLISGYTPLRHTAWIIITRLLLALFIGACLGMVCLPRILARSVIPAQAGIQTSYSGYTAGIMRRAFFFGLVLPLALIMFAVNLIASLLPAFDIYSPDDPERFEQRALSALKAKSLMSFWAHPEAPDHNELKYLGVPFAVDTRPYPEVLLQTRGYTGFAGVNEGENMFVDPGSVWDTLLRQYLDGQRAEPVWCFGEMLYHYEGQAGKKLANVETMVFSPEKTAAALLESIRKGHFYARHNYQGQSLNLDQWQVNGLESGQTGPNRSAEGGSASGGEPLNREPLNHVDISLRVSAKIPGEKAEVLIIRNGAVIKKDNLVLPFELEINDALPPVGSKAYYRAVVSAKYPLRLVTNPVFIRRKG